MYYKIIGLFLCAPKVVIGSILANHQLGKKQANPERLHIFVWLNSLWKSLLVREQSNKRLLLLMGYCAQNNI